MPFHDVHIMSLSERLRWLNVTRRDSDANDHDPDLANDGADADNGVSQEREELDRALTPPSSSYRFFICFINTILHVN